MHTSTSIILSCYSVCAIIAKPEATQQTISEWDKRQVSQHSPLTFFSWNNLVFMGRKEVFMYLCLSHYYSYPLPPPPPPPDQNTFQLEKAWRKKKPVLNILIVLPLCGNSCIHGYKGSLLGSWLKNLHFMCKMLNWIVSTQKCLGILL